jgi:hypothetical protein
MSFFGRSILALGSAPGPGSGHDLRPAGQVRRRVLGLLACSLCLHLALAARSPAPAVSAPALPAAPAPGVLRLAAFGEPVALAKILMLWLQAFDFRSGSRMPYRALDYPSLVQWLSRILDLDPGGQYPLMSASRIYAEVPDPAKQRLMLDFIESRYLEDPDRRWPWMAHATLIAKHELHDLPLARRYARNLQAHTTAADVPVWVTQMEAFIDEDMNELEAARILIGGIIASGRLAYPQEAEILRNRLAAIEAKIARQRAQDPGRARTPGPPTQRAP